MKRRVFKCVFLMFLVTLFHLGCKEEYRLPVVEIDSIGYVTPFSAIVYANVVDGGNDLVFEKGVCWSEHPNSTIKDSSSYTFMQDTGKYYSPLYTLQPGGRYFVRAYARNGGGTSYSDEKVLDLPETEYMIDSRDGQKYATVKIANLVWMAENLNYYTPRGSWYYDRDSVKYHEWGRLYNWKTAKEACPDGWHLPSDEEWMELEKSIGVKVEKFMTQAEVGKEAGKLKEPGILHWEYESDSVTNETGFTAIPGGAYNLQNDTFVNLGIYAFFWTATLDEGMALFRRYWMLNNAIVRKSADTTAVGYSVRCVKDD